MPFRVALTRDFLNPDGSLALGDIGLDLLDADPEIERFFLPELTREIEPRHLAGADALLLLGPQLTAASLEGAETLRLVARFGVGYDNVDVAACTAKGVLLTITPDGVRRPVAAAALTLILALTHRLLQKDRLTRAGGWARKVEFMGRGVTGRTLGVLGLGNIGREVFRLAAPLEMRHVGHDPAVSVADAAAAGIEWLELDSLFEAADYLVIACALTPATRHLVDARRLALMRPDAYLINVARGPIVDQQALTTALLEGWIAGAGLDVFEEEPVSATDPILQLENVIVAPHALCWTDECFRGNGRSACRSIVDVAHGRMPAHVVNPEAWRGCVMSGEQR